MLSFAYLPPVRVRRQPSKNLTVEFLNRYRRVVSETELVTMAGVKRPDILRLVCSHSEAHDERIEELNARLVELPVQLCGQVPEAG